MASPRPGNDLAGEALIAEFQRNGWRTWSKWLNALRHSSTSKANSSCADALPVGQLRFFGGPNEYQATKLARKAGESEGW